MANGHHDATVVPLPEPPPQGDAWQAVIGSEGRRLIARALPGPEGDAVLETAASILSRGTPPNAHQGQQTGLVVGYVQSGKTLSFTTVIALARDNGFRLVVVVAGTSLPLLRQSVQRLRRDLQIDDPDGHLRWRTYTNPTDDENTRRFIQQSLDEWNDPDVPANEKATVLVTVMKQHHHLRNLVSLLRRLRLEDVPTLVIDDEADQASLNTRVNQGRESTTYRRLLDLRDSAPVHTFLQYTATPQAPLLINIIDVLSPSFVEVLEPGPAYTGGAIFFGGARQLVRPIPLHEIPTDDNPLVDPPSTLLEALRIFMVGVAAGILQGQGAGNLNRSMLVHPSRQTLPHRDYRVWIGRAFDDWQRILELPPNDPDRVDLMQDFEDAHRDLARTVPDLPAFDQIERALLRAFRRTSIEEVNARGRATPSIDWRRAYGWILVGGQAMDRGFTVEGLTVTYMPRHPGVGNADTLQQRGRFFGYKRGYLGFCRIYLEQQVLTAFEEYVVHEEEMRRQLEEVRDRNESLTDWKRAFILSPALRPCRTNVVRYDYARGTFSNSWFAPRLVLTTEAVRVDNSGIAQRYVNGLQFQPNEGHPDRELAQRHEICRGIPLREAMEQLLIPFRFIAAEDTKDVTGLLLQLSHALEQDAGERCTIVRMSPDYARHRGVDDNGKVKNLFQGAAPVNPPERRGSIYPGDREVHEPDTVTVQIHDLALTQGPDDAIVARHVPVITVWVPRRMAMPWIVQEQPAAAN
jgi:hypothetical protein